VEGFGDDMRTVLNIWNFNGGRSLSSSATLKMWLERSSGLCESPPKMQ